MFSLVCLGFNSNLLASYDQMKKSWHFYIPIIPFVWGISVMSSKIVEDIKKQYPLYFESFSPYKTISLVNGKIWIAWLKLK